MRLRHFSSFVVVELQERSKRWRLLPHTPDLFPFHVFRLPDFFLILELNK